MLTGITHMCPKQPVYIFFYHLDIMWAKLKLSAKSTFTGEEIIFFVDEINYLKTIMWLFY